MSCGGKDTNGWSANMPALTVINFVAGKWAEYIKNEVPNKMTSANVPMTPGQTTACSMTFNGTTYYGSSKSGFHAEVDCLNQAYNAREDLGSGEFKTLTNSVCQICAAVLYGVGVTAVPERASSSKEYPIYKLPSWVFLDDSEGGVLYRILGEKAWKVWMNHLSEINRGDSMIRQSLVTAMNEILRSK